MRVAPSLLSVLAVASPFSLFLFFLFSLSSEPVSCDIAVTSTLPRPHTGDIPSLPPSTPSPPPRHCNYCTNPVAATTAATSPLAGMPTTRCTRPHTRRGHTQATPLPSPSLFLAHLKKPQISHPPFFSPSFLMVQDTLPPSTQACCTLPWHASTHPTSPRAHACHPFALPTTTTTSMPLRLASPDFATQTGGAKGALAPTISATPPFTHPPRLCRSSHSRGCPRWPPLFTCPAPPAVLSCMPGGEEGQRAPSPLCLGYANRAPWFTRPASHACPPSLRACRGVQEGLGGMHARGRAAHKGRGRECERASGLRTNRRGCAPFPPPLRPVDRLRKIPCTVLVNKI